MYKYTNDIAQYASLNPDMQPDTVEPRKRLMLGTVVRNGRVAVPNQSKSGYVGKTHKTKNKVSWGTSKAVPKFDVTIQCSYYVTLKNGKEYRISLKRGNLIMSENVIHDADKWVLGTFKTVYGKDVLKFYPCDVWYRVTAHLDDYARLITVLSKFQGDSPYFKYLDVWRNELAELRLKLETVNKDRQDIRDSKLSPSQKNALLKQNESCFNNLLPRIQIVEDTLQKHSKKLPGTRQQEIISVYATPEIRFAESRNKTHRTTQRALSASRPSKKDRQARQASLRNGQVLDI